MCADELARGARMRHLAQQVAHLLAAARDRRDVLVVVGQCEEDAFDLLVDRRGEQAERLDARRLRAERRIRLVGREHTVHLAGDLAEPVQPAEEPLRVFRQLVERELPAVEAPAHVLLQDSERRRQRPARVRVPAPERRDVGEVVLGEEAEHLELGVDARLEAAKHLEDELVVEDDRRVRLLRADVACVDQLASEPGEALHRTELDDAFVTLQREAGAHCADELARDPEGLLLREEQLVDVVSAGVVPELREGERVLRVRRPQRDRVDDLCVCDVPRLGAVPALMLHVLDELGLIDHACCLKRNQKNPLGASVNRYGSSPIGGKLVLPNISSGTIPAYRERSSWTGWADRARL